MGGLNIVTEGKAVFKDSSKKNCLSQGMVKAARWAILKLCEASYERAGMHFNFVDYCFYATGININQQWVKCDDVVKWFIEQEMT